MNMTLPSQHCFHHALWRDGLAIQCLETVAWSSLPGEVVNESPSPFQAAALLGALILFPLSKLEEDGRSSSSTVEEESEWESYLQSTK